MASSSNDIAPVQSAIEDARARQASVEGADTNKLTFTEFLGRELEGKRKVEVSKKSLLVEHAKDCMQNIFPECLRLFLRTLPLESDLAAAMPGGAEPFDNTKVSETVISCFNELADAARACFDEKTIQLALQHCEGASSNPRVSLALERLQNELLRSLEERARPCFKDLKRKELVSLKGRIESLAPDGVHALVDELCSKVADAMNNSLGEVDVDDICARVWNETKKTTSSQASGTRCSESLGTSSASFEAIGAEEKRMMDKEESRRNKNRSGAVNTVNLALINKIFRQS